MVAPSVPRDARSKIPPGPEGTGAAMGIAKFLFWAGIIIAIVLFVLGMTIAKKVT